MSPSFEDIDSKVEKAQGDKARFLKSKEGLLPHFEFPSGETKEEKHYSKETLLADMYEEKLDQMKEAMQNPILLENAYIDLKKDATRGSEKEGKNTGSAAWALLSISAFVIMDRFSRLFPEKQNEINLYIENPIFLENVYKILQDDVVEGSEKEGEDKESCASLAFRTLSALITTHFISRLSAEQQNKIVLYFENPILLENAYQYIEDRVIFGSKKEEKNTGSAAWALLSISALITTDILSRFSPERQNKINSYLESSTLLENIFQRMGNSVGAGSEKEGINAENATWAFQIFSSLATVKDYLREKGKKIDDENFAKEALNPTEKIPPRPEGILGK